MANFFEGIPQRSNADIGMVDASWWNTMRQYLVNYYEEFFEGGVAETQFTIADNQAAYQNITGLVVDKDVTQSFDLEYTIYRTDGATPRRERGTLYAHYKGTTWTFTKSIHHGDLALGDIDDALYVVPATGQVQYKSDSMGGTYVGKIRYKILTSFLKEV